MHYFSLCCSFSYSHSVVCDVVGGQRSSECYLVAGIFNIFGDQRLLESFDGNRGKVLMEWHACSAGFLIVGGMNGRNKELTSRYVGQFTVETRRRVG